MQLLLLLSLIREEDNAHVKAFFKTDKKGDTVLSVITFMWPTGESLLSTHADVIYCDSMWGTEQRGSKLATVVVVDHDDAIRLAAAAIMDNETAEAWGIFFNWVKECVPTFCPKCVVTDGAAFIFSEFEEYVKTPSTTEHISCWWHQRNTNIRNYGGGSFPKKLGGLTYSDIFSSLQQRRDELDHEINASKSFISEKEIESKYLLLEEYFEKAYINLKVFTGGTVTNSYAESVNKQLRDIGLNTKQTRFETILTLRGYCKYPRVKIAKLSAKNEEIIKNFTEEDVKDVVSNGVLRQMLRLSKQAPIICKTTQGKDSDTFFVQEKIDVPIARNWAISRNALGIVIWGKDGIKCSCNKLVYRGMPCIHIVHVAQENKRRIPLKCFNERFFSKVSEKTMPDKEAIGVRTQEKGARITYSRKNSGTKGIQYRYSDHL